ncbi:MAG: GNAT family N-acetyltransferase [Nocardioides sp.]|uniref:GNAT family N-acetyltransferase n=1 Tax=Nocardioides sp. TaxID=35761 RepID=UPI0039E3E902
MSDLVIRPMRPDDLSLAERVSAEAFYEVDVRMHTRGAPPPQRRPAERAATWIARTGRWLETDPAGCWVATDRTGLAGFATSFVRQRLWCLATFAVAPHRQGAGLGRRLLETVLGYADRCGCTRSMLSASSDPAALRRYRLAGFALHPMMLLHGTLDRSLIPPVDGVREGDTGDTELLDAIDRDLRGAGHEVDHQSLARMGSLIVDRAGQGYAYVEERGPVLLAARDETTATRLLWESLGRAGESPVVAHITGANQWALDVGLAARLSLGFSGALGVRDLAPPAPYLHHGALL